MNALLALVTKELLEIVGDPFARRGGFIQAGVFILVLGVLTPLSTSAAWLSGSPHAIVFYAFLPGVSAAAIAADAFAGERERKTLETLLATPLSEATILAGKAIAAVTWALLLALIGLVVGTLVVGLSAGAFVPAPMMIVGALGAAFASASFMTAMAIVVSMLIPAARPAQQVASIGSSAVIGAGLAVWNATGLALNWTNVYVVEAVWIVAAFIVLTAARLLFRRDRLLGG